MQSEQDAILVVDDQPANLKVLLSFLQEHDYRVYMVDSGQRALDILPKIQPDLVLLDVMMPGMNGFEICRRIKADKNLAALPIIFMTALDSVGDKVTGFAAGAVDYITKPFQQVEVLARINTHITLRKREKELEEALEEIKTLTGILPICSYCKQIRNDEGYWQQVEEYISEHSQAMFSHGVCPACYKKEMACLEAEDVAED
ncbi:Response regulator receiver domain-containing protein [Candidatus Electrothrix aarhusensis]|jgi:DNA-binding response OmpR family regulator|uniref:Response regulator receiver domain-containing protein n=1 Tax=Candidatus Electrothrix aarhusensis TaxID=1859131 RepID=A0A444J2E3_9BACT|nr:Response regulator receiver domain-containing protein [Candidatus Electrothrix aarhusensis]